MFQLVNQVFSGFVSVAVWRTTKSDKLILVVRSTNSCSGLLFDRTRMRVLLVRQNRAPMVREDNPGGEIREEHLDPGETFGIAEKHEVATRHWVPVARFLAGPHDDLRVYAPARELECCLLREAGAAR